VSQLFATRTLESLQKDAEATDGHRLRRALGPVGLTAVGVGAIIGAGIFVMTGRVAAQDAGPAIILSYVVAGVGCALAAFCYAEFAAMAPVAGSAYTYAAATLGELFAWVIGWDLVLEYAMSCSTVASAWSEYFNKFIEIISEQMMGSGHKLSIPKEWMNDPFSGGIMNLPAVGIMLFITTILVIGIRQSSFFNTLMVGIKLAVVLFVIVIGISYVAPANWTTVPTTDRQLPGEKTVKELVEGQVKNEAKLREAAEKWAKSSYGTGLKGVTVALESGAAQTLPPLPTLPRLPESEDKAENERRKAENERLSKEEQKLRDQEVEQRTEQLLKAAIAEYKIQYAESRNDQELLARVKEKYSNQQAKGERDKAIVIALLAEAKDEVPKATVKKWGLLGAIGLNEVLAKVDDSVRSNFMPYGLSGIIFGASLVFFAYIGFDAVSTHAEEAKNPKRDLPIGIIGSLALCTVLYIAVSAIITGMVKYPDIDPKAAIATAFDDKGKLESSKVLSWAGALIALGGLAGMTSVLLITFQSQARVFLAMSRDGLLPPAVFAVVHPRFKTPHRSTMLTGLVITAAAAFTPITVLEEMVNIGTLLAFVIVCAAVLVLRVKRPDAARPFRTPLVFVLAPLGILVNVTMMLFLPIETWWRLVGWLVAGLVIYFGYGYWNSTLRRRQPSDRYPIPGGLTGPHSV
jgi:amino acid transporter